MEGRWCRRSAGPDTETAWPCVRQSGCRRPGACRGRGGSAPPRSLPGARPEPSPCLEHPGADPRRVGLDVGAERREHAVVDREGGCRGLEGTHRDRFWRSMARTEEHRRLEISAVVLPGCVRSALSGLGCRIFVRAFFERRRFSLLAAPVGQSLTSGAACRVWRGPTHSATGLSRMTSS